MNGSVELSRLRGYESYAGIQGDTSCQCEFSSVPGDIIIRRPISTLTAGTMLAVFGGTCFATLFVWRDRVRPPVSLREALDIAEQLLGDDAKNRYCVDVSIYGNPMGAPKPGAWNLLFAAEDGSKKQVYVDMDRNSKLTTWNEAIDWKKDAGRRTNLNDVLARLKALFDKENLDAQLELQNGHLVGRYRTRIYQIYKIQPNGSYSTELTEEIGPEHDGFAFDAEIVDEGSDYFHFDSAAYWMEYTQVYPTTVKGRLLVARKKYGRDFRKELHSQIDQAFGIDFINP